jgi:glycosyltransferase involved in cell wall biosynthesis
MQRKDSMIHESIPNQSQTGRAARAVEAMAIQAPESPALSSPNLQKTNRMISSRMNILLVMEQCNPEWPSVPGLAYQIYNHLSRLAQVKLVTHERNETALRDARPGADIDFITEPGIIRNYYRCVDRLTSKGSTNWPLQHALGYPVYAAFDRSVLEQYGGAVEEGRYDAVIAATPILPRYPYSISKACTNVPFILGPVNGGLPFPKGFGEIARQEHAHFNFLRRIGRAIPGYADSYRRAAKVLAGSQHTLEWLRDSFGVSPEKLELFHENGVTKNYFEAANAKPRNGGEPLRILFAGRLVPYKGADMLIEAFARLARRERTGPLELVIAGDGPQRPVLESLARESGVGNMVRFTGRLAPAQMPAVFGEADLFAFPSIREFGGAVVMEAMAAGLPCVVVDHGGIGEYVSDDCGIKITPSSRKHIIHETARGIETLLDRPALRQSMSEAAAIRARQFSWEAKTERIIQIIQEAIGNPQPRLATAAA